MEKKLKHYNVEYNKDGMTYGAIVIAADYDEAREKAKEYFGNNFICIQSKPQYFPSYAVTPFVINPQI